ISTLEHVGRDNRVYGVRDAHDDRGIGTALGELARVGARILVTVPTGADEDHGWFVQLPVAAWRELFAGASLAIAEEEVYELGPGGWAAAENGAPGAGYGTRGSAASAVYGAELRALEHPVVAAPASGADAEDDERGEDGDRPEGDQRVHEP